MESFTKQLSLLGIATLLVIAPKDIPNPLQSCSTAWAVTIKTSDGNGADTELREDEAITRGGAKDLNSRLETSPANLEIIALRFDLTGIDSLTIDNAQLDVFTNRTGMR